MRYLKIKHFVQTPSNQLILSIKTEKRGHGNKLNQSWVSLATNDFQCNTMCYTIYTD